MNVTPMETMPPFMNVPHLSAPVKIVDGVYRDRFNHTHPMSSDGFAPFKITPNASGGPPGSPPSERSIPCLQLAPARPPEQSPEGPSHPSCTSNTTAPRGTSYLARTVEEDTRPARRTDEVCRLFLIGLCPYKDECFRAHIHTLSAEKLEMLPTEGSKQRTPNVQVPVPVHPSREKEGPELCKLNLVGKCPKGDKCSYSHDLGPPITPSNVPAPDAAAAASVPRKPSPTPTAVGLPQFQQRTSLDAVVGPTRFLQPSSSSDSKESCQHALPPRVSELSGFESGANR
ncbi:hypothetical protein C8Q76DRAFT_54807 [Earliella scabrosa]|nr:hypothetical protein C8Q76DRAFT_54807 [Earliella scabrosa]